MIEITCQLLFAATDVSGPGYQTSLTRLSLNLQYLVIGWKLKLHCLPKTKKDSRISLPSLYFLCVYFKLLSIIENIL